MTTNQSQQFSSNQSDRHLNSQPKGMPRQLDKYVWGFVGVIGLFFASFPIAYARVAHSEKFDAQQPVHSIGWDETQKSNLIYPEPK